MPIIAITGLVEFQRSLKTIDAALPRLLRTALNDAVEPVAAKVRAAMPSKTGRAARTVKTSSQQRSAQIKEGSAKARYVPWLDFGGKRTGRGGGVATRPFYSDGRFLYRTFYDLNDEGELERRLLEGLVDVGRQAGIEVQP